MEKIKHTNFGPKLKMFDNKPTMSYNYSHFVMESAKKHYLKKNLLCPRFLTICGLFTLSYAMLVRSSYKSQNEIIRLAGAGSLSHLMTEICYFPLDSLNLTQKLQVNNISTSQMLRIVYNHYGPYGIYRGFTVSYYSSTSSGFFFFACYKSLKMKMKEIF